MTTTTNPWTKTCSCGRVFRALDFYMDLNPPNGGSVQPGETDAEKLVLRNCSCGSTLATGAKDLAEELRRLSEGSGQS